jgi:hypothetical protein
LHVTVLHELAEHTAVAFGREQTLPHAPQLESDVRRSVSHPFVGFPSQSPKPGLQLR